MSQETINIGTNPNDGTGDKIRVAFQKVNNNFTELYATSGNANVDLTSISSNVLPSANVTYNLGSDTLRWKELWLSGNTIYLGNTTLSVDANDELLINGSAITGTQGAQGTQGADGSNGAVGIQGTQGPSGGPQGTQGAQGTAGSSGVGSSINTQILFNDSNSVAGNAGLVYTKTARQMVVGNLSVGYGGSGNSTAIAPESGYELQIFSSASGGPAGSERIFILPGGNVANSVAFLQTGITINCNSQSSTWNSSGLFLTGNLNISNGTLVFSDTTVQNTAYPGFDQDLNTTDNVKFNITTVGGLLTEFGYIGVANGDNLILSPSDGNVFIQLPGAEIEDGNYVMVAHEHANGIVQIKAGANTWDFYANSEIKFPDDTIQNTAFTGSAPIAWVSVPVSNTASGTAGQAAYDANGDLYICVASNTWSKFTGTLIW